MSRSHVSCGLALASLAALLLGAVPALAGQRRPRTLGADQVWSDAPPVPRAGGPNPVIVYVSMGGPTMSPGPNNSRENTSQIVEQTTTFTPFKSQDPAARAALLRCTKILFGRFGVTVTDVDPGPGVQHIEAVVTGATSAEIGARSSLLGVSPFTCGLIPSSVVYVFGAYYANDIQNVCETVGQEVAHSFGLEHEALCEDPMTYDGGCGAKTFQDVDAPCGEYEREPMPCDCEGRGDTQNSVREMLALLGPGENVPPTVALTTPADGSMISGAVVVHADAADGNLVVNVSLHVDGTQVQEDQTPPFEFPLPRNLALGEHELKVVAIDPAGNTAEAVSTITVEAQCATDAECDAAAGETCAGFYCARALGGICETQDECVPGLLCGVELEEQRCTRGCGEGLEGCPGGFSCLEGLSGTGKCWPSTGGGGGCTATPGRRGASAWIVLGLAAGLLCLFLADRRFRH